MKIAPWRLIETPPGAAARPSDLVATQGFETTASSVAEALMARGALDPLFPRDLDQSDWWWLAELEGEGAHLLRLDGLAGVAEVFLGDAPVLTSRNMFRRHEVVVELQGRARLAICCRALAPLLPTFKGRARWRPRAVDDSKIRFLRTTLLGRMPGFAPLARVVGPTGGVTLAPLADAPPRVSFATRLDGAEGVVTIEIAPGLAGPAQGEALLECGGRSARAALDARGRARLTLRLPDVAPWFPSTHGRPVLHPAQVRLNGVEIATRRLGFRRIEIDRDVDGEGFGLCVNGLPIFARGAVWVPPSLPGVSAPAEALREPLAAMVDAGMNLVRAPGWLAPQDRAFYDLCDALGLMVWQDFPFANLDYPATDPAFCDEVRAEAQDFFNSVGPAPSLVALCGASEVAQQAAMLGLPRESWSNAIFDALLPEIVAERRPDVPYLPHTPWGGELPFTPDKGVVHYYGVSAYKRPFEDAALARPRFAAEWLGFNHIPEHDPALDEEGVAQPVFGAKIEGDTGAVWWFEGVRDHYLREMYGRDPAALRREDPAAYLDFSRAVTAEAAGEILSRFRRHGAPTRGAVALMLRDAFAPGAGWGLLDHQGRKKPIWHALARAFRPVRAILTDEGLNGARITLINETAELVAARLTLTCLREGATPVASGARDMTLAPRSSQIVAATDLLGAFFDVTYAYRFGAPSHDVVMARLEGGEGVLLDETFLFPLGRAAALREAGLAARLETDAHGSVVAISAQRFAQSVRVVAPGFEAQDGMFHLPPGVERRVRLVPRSGAPAQAAGDIMALGSAHIPFG
jgi:beta-mannosidase